MKQYSGRVTSGKSDSSSRPFTILTPRLIKRNILSMPPQRVFNRAGTGYEIEIGPAWYILYTSDSILVYVHEIEGYLQAPLNDPDLSELLMNALHSCPALIIHSGIPISNRERPIIGEWPSD